MLGLTLATTTIAACSDDTKTPGSGGNGGMGGIDMSGSMVAAAYGIAPASSGPGGMGGMGGTSGTGGTGGTGGMGGSK